MKKRKNVCCICGKEYSGYGNNAKPLKEGKCCDSCNKEYVIPYRLQIPNDNKRTAQESNTLKFKKNVTMKKVKIERTKDLFDEKTCQKMLNEVRGRGECHRNAVFMYCLLNNAEKNVKYVEGYLGPCGHVINSIERNGVTHYFDISQEWLIEKGIKKEFTDEFGVVYEQFGNVIMNKVLRERCSRLYKVKQLIFEDRKYYNAA